MTVSLSATTSHAAPGRAVPEAAAPGSDAARRRVRRLRKAVAKQQIVRASDALAVADLLLGLNASFRDLADGVPSPGGAS